VLVCLAPLVPISPSPGWVSRRERREGGGSPIGVAAHQEGVPLFVPLVPFFLFPGWMSGGGGKGRGGREEGEEGGRGWRDVL
jgi:hypothetical protein